MGSSFLVMTPQKGFDAVAVRAITHSLDGIKLLTLICVNASQKDNPL